MMTSLRTTRTLRSLAESKELITTDQFIELVEQDLDEARYSHAELIDGIVVMNAAVGRYHGRPQQVIATWLGNYEAATEGVESFPSVSLVLDQTSMPEPDACLRITDDYSGTSTADRYIHGPPELVVEISVSSQDRDLGSKKNTYERMGVLEYFVWRVDDGEIDYFSLINNQFVLQTVTSGIIKSRTFGGLWLDVSAALRLDLRGVLKTLQTGLSSADFKAFTTSMKSRKRQ
ncbi:Uma2 family endonuclease [Lacunimicrobium album]